MDIQLCDKHLIYSALISRYKKDINILDMATEYLDITIKYIRCFPHTEKNG